MEPVETDVAVVGGGMAGLAAAVTAAQAGRSVTLLEKAPELGGSMRLSAGLIWSYDEVERARITAPKGQPRLQRLVIEGLDDAFEWLSARGVDLQKPPVELPTGDVVTAPTPGANCRKMDPEAYIDRFSTLIRSHDGRIKTETPMTELRTDDGRVTGLRTPTDHLAAGAVVLATGGFQGDPELVSRHVCPPGVNIQLRSNPWSTGDGFHAATATGAATSRGLETFYGHNLAAPPAQPTPETFLDLTQYYGPFAIAIDASGRRFTDESESELEHTLAQDTLHHANGQVHYVIDQALYDDEVFSMGRVGDIVERADQAGAAVIRAETRRELATRLDEAGVNGEQAVATIDAYNEAVSNGQATALSPPRERHGRAIDEPPFYAVPVQPGITFTMGGLSVDPAMQVRSRTGSGSGLLTEPGAVAAGANIPGLFAAGADVGGIHNRGYLGGLATALVTGRRAGEAAAETTTA